MGQLLPESLFPPAPGALDTRGKEGRITSRQRLVASGALSLVALTFVESIYRLGSRAISTVQAGLSPSQWLALIAIVAGFVYVEGYRALQGKVAPLVVSRALEIGSRKLCASTVLSAPLYSLALVGAPRPVLLRAWFAVALIAVAVWVVRALPFPLRGFVDAGVAAALTWGLGALISEFWRRALAKNGLPGGR